MNDDQDKPKHSPTPWHAEPTGLHGIYAADGALVADWRWGHKKYEELGEEIESENRDFIVQAVNQHAALVALRDAVEEHSHSRPHRLSEHIRNLIAATHEAEKVSS